MRAGMGRVLHALCGMLVGASSWRSVGLHFISFHLMSISMLSHGPAVTGDTSTAHVLLCVEACPVILSLLSSPPLPSPLPSSPHLLIISSPSIADQAQVRSEGS